MADKYAGGIKAGSTGVSVELVLRSATDGTEITGKVAADLTATYRRQGALRTSISLSNLAAIDSAWSSGGVKEDTSGAYRLDLPDAAVATGADFLMVLLSTPGSYVSHQMIPLETKGAAENNTLIAAIKAKTDSLTFTNALKVDAAVLAAGDLAQAAADKVWASAARTLTSFGTLVADTATAVWGSVTRALTSVGNIVSGVWDEPAASHNTAGTLGNKLNAAASAGDPWSTAIPGAYPAGQAGYVLGNLTISAADISAIKGKTDQLTFTTPGLVDASSGLSAASIASAVWAKVIETQGAITAQQALDILLAVMAGTSDNGGLLFKSPNGGATRVTGVKGPTGDRTTVTLTPSA